MVMNFARMTSMRDALPVIRYRRCEYYSTRTNILKLFKVRDKWSCLACGERMIREWNEAVKAVSSDTINMISPR